MYVCLFYCFQNLKIAEPIALKLFVVPQMTLKNPKYIKVIENSKKLLFLQCTMYKRVQLNM